MSRKQARIHNASAEANALMTLAQEVRAAVRAKLSRPPEENPRAEVLLKVGPVASLATRAIELAERHRRAVAESERAAGLAKQFEQDNTRLQRELERMTNRFTNAEAQIRRLRLAAGEDVA